MVALSPGQEGGPHHRLGVVRRDLPQAVVRFQTALRQLEVEIASAWVHLQNLEEVYQGWPWILKMWSLPPGWWTGAGCGSGSQGSSSSLKEASPRPAAEDERFRLRCNLDVADCILYSVQFRVFCTYYALTCILYGLGVPVPSTVYRKLPALVWMYNVFSTRPASRPRNTTSNVVFPPGGITCVVNRLRVGSSGN